MKSLQHFLQSRLLPLSIILAGSLLRLKLYLENRSFWLDEAWLALDISLRSFQDILYSKILAPDMPVVPLGFALVERFWLQVWGYHEYALRLFPFICGLGSVVIFYTLTRYWLKAGGRTLALILFSFSGALILYASEMKQYSTDLAVALGIYWLYARPWNDALRTRHFLTWCAAGMLAVFFSYAVVFILAAIALVNMAPLVRARDWPRFKSHLIICIFWMICFGCFHGTVVRGMTAHPTLMQGAIAKGYFPAYPLLRPETFFWFGRAVRDYFGEFLGLQPVWAGLVLFAVGGAALFRQERERFYVLSVPCVLALAAALLHKYPFGHRFLLFAAPFVFIFIGVGFERLWRPGPWILRIGGVVLAGALVFSIFKDGTFYLLNRYEHGAYRDVIRLLNAQALPQDSLYLNNSAKYLYGYYFKTGPAAVEISPVAKFADEVSREGGRPYILRQFVWHDFSHPRIIALARRFGEVVKLDAETPNMFGDNPRTWFLLAHFKPEVKEFILLLADGNGKRLQEYKRQGAELYLYDFSR